MDLAEMDLSEIDFEVLFYLVENTDLHMGRTGEGQCFSRDIKKMLVEEFHKRHPHLSKPWTDG